MSRSTTSTTPSTKSPSTASRAALDPPERSPSQVLSATFEEIDAIFSTDDHLPSVDFPRLMTALFVRRYTGSIRIDFRNGSPKVYSFDRPRRGQIVPA